MIKSMTGYGRCEKVLEGKKILCEIKSVNHRFSDYSIKVPRYMQFLEDRARRLASRYITRGKVDIYIGIEYFEVSDTDIVVNESIAKSYIDALTLLRDKFGLEDDISVSSVARYSDIFKSQRKTEDEDEVWEQVSGVLTEAIESFSDMREREGERIYRDLYSRVDYMKTIASEIDERSPKVVADYKSRLYDKIKETLGDRNIDEARVLTEVAIFADKVAINEETVRLASHFEEYYQILNGTEPAGRRLDFLIQEINREVNTIGSKANDIEIAKRVVDLKGEIEKMREQIQNIE